MSQDGTVVLLSFTNGNKLDETNYASFAEKIFRDAKNMQENRNHWFGKLTTTKLRSIYGLIMNVYTKINEPSDFKKHQSDIQYLQVKMAYESGREQSVAEFIGKTHLMDAVSRIKTYEQFLLYCRYAESLVAYFKFYGGRDK
mgnify:CR=1 FL=1